MRKFYRLMVSIICKNKKVESHFRYVEKRLRSFIELYIKRKKRYLVNNKVVECNKLLELKNKHVFFGYYDLPAISKDGTKLLVQVVEKWAIPGCNKAEIGYFEISDDEKGYNSISTTGAWCWQQSSRLRWHPLDSGKVLFNDIHENRYVTKIAEISGKSIDAETVIEPALYDISNDFRYGVSLNFSRLERLRPGYGYSALPDETADIYAPHDDGLFLVDIEYKTSKLIVSLSDLAVRNDKNLTHHHYINCVSFCPDGRKFLFYHISVPENLPHIMKIEPYVYFIDTGEARLLENDWKTICHYCWRNNNELMFTVINMSDELSYVIYSLKEGGYTEVEHSTLKRDGHPSFFMDEDTFVYDTYPDKFNYQKLFMHNIPNNETEMLADFYHKPVKSVENRCDLHPRIWENGNKKIITVDTTCTHGLRKVALITMAKEHKSSWV